MGMDDLNEFVPQLRPHNIRRGHHLYFMISRRPFLELSSDDISLYDGIDGQLTVADLERVYPGARDRLLKWHDAFVLELIAPLPQPKSPHLVVIEPHMDDAAISVGGRLLHRRGRQRITVISVVKWTNFTSYLSLNRAFLNVTDITKLRLQESALAARLLGAETCCLDWPDAPLRFWPAERWSERTVDRYTAEPANFVDLLPNPKDVTGLAEQLARLLVPLAPDELWIPMGLGDHVDHRTTRSACLMMLAEARGRFSNLPVIMYEDLPYAVESKHSAQIQAALASAGTRFIPGREDITDVFRQKMRLVSIYASQFKLSYMEPLLRKLAERETGVPGMFAEAYHQLVGERKLPLESQLSPEASGLATLKREVRGLPRERTILGRLTVLALPSGHLGRWETDSKTLAEAFPNAQRQFYVSEKVVWQAHSHCQEQPGVRIVRGGRLGCVGAILRQFLDFRTPTVVLSAGAYNSKFKRKLIKTLLPFRQVLFAKKLCEFCGVLNEQIRNFDG